MAARSRIDFVPMPGNQARAAAMVQALSDRADAALLACQVHRFPDGERLVQVQAPRAGSQAVLVCTLADPDVRTVSLLMAAATLRELGAVRVGLVAPYLAYMRQDRQFIPGQAVSARIYGRLLSEYFDWLVTVDPHLHRIHDLSEVYTLRSRIVRAAPRLAQWIKAAVERPVIIGPDRESAQWAADVAARAGAPVVVVEKVRRGDRDVQSGAPDLRAYAGCTPVLIDDIISSGRTLVAVLQNLRHAQMAAPVCVAVHGLFADDALAAMHAAGAVRVACSDTCDAAIGAGSVEIIGLNSDLAHAALELAATFAPGGAAAGAGCGP